MKIIFFLFSTFVFSNSFQCRSLFDFKETKFEEFKYLLKKANEKIPPELNEAFIIHYVKGSDGNIYQRLENPLFETLFLSSSNKEYDNAVKLYLRSIFGNAYNNSKLGTYFQINEDIAYLTMRVSDLHDKTHLPRVLRDSFFDYLKKLQFIYEDRLGLSSVKFAELQRISLKCSKRSRLHLVTESMLYGKSENPNFTPQFFFPRKFSDQIDFYQNKINYTEDYFLRDKTIDESFKITSGAISVRSDSIDEKLPLEMLHGITVPRPNKSNPLERQAIAEIGRFHSSSFEETINLVKIAAFELSRGAKRLHDVTKIYIEVDEVRRRLFQKYGFEEYLVLKGNDYYRNNKSYIMQVEMETFLKKTFED